MITKMSLKIIWEQFFFLVHSLFCVFCGNEATKREREREREKEREKERERERESTFSPLSCLFPSLKISPLVFLIFFSFFNTLN